MNKSYLAALAAVPLLLSACSRGEEGDSDGDRIQIDLSDESTPDSEKISIGGDGEGKFSIKADGFSMDMDLPSITLDADDLDLNNVELYPGSKITNFKIQDVDGDGGKVILDFVAPTDEETLSTWFEEQMAAGDYKFEKDGNNLSGTSEDGDPFTLNLSQKSADETAGTLELAEKS